MRCAICKRSSDEVRLYTGILETDMVMACDSCAESEGIPLIKKPSESQLNKADERRSVRERMETMSGMRKTTEISQDQMVTQGNLAKLRVPPRKQHHEDVVDNYYWTLNLARRRKKISIGQLAVKMQVSREVIQGIERGMLPDDFHEVFLKLESFLGVKLLKAHKKKMHLTRNLDEEAEILESVKKKMQYSGESVDEKIEKISSGEMDFSRREDLSDVTLNDLVDRKKEEDKRKVKEKEDTMLGDDIDLDIEVL